MNKLMTALAMPGLLLSGLCLGQPAGMTEVEEMVAKMQVQETLYRYALYHNTDKPVEYADLFTEDANLMGAILGREAILDMARGEVTKMAVLGTTEQGEYNFGFMRSLILNPVIDILDATHAHAFSYLAVVVPNVDDENKPTILSMGSYEDDLEKVDGKWLIANRRAYGGMSYPGLGAKLGLGPNARRTAPAGSE